MDFATFRDRYRTARRTVLKSGCGWARAHAQANLRLDAIYKCAEEGLSLKETAARVEMLPNSIRTALKRRHGSGAWPPK